jgi:2-keto-4-pentenoate hydratase/2-oxohepta-3-ene-1,7-dioic acid hydratase in catechol pathway
MKIFRFLNEDNSPSFGWVSEEKAGLISGDPYNQYHREPAKLDYQKLNILPPVLPSKIICVGRNYAAHAQEHDVEVPETPLIFLKPPTTIIGHRDEIVLPPQSNHVEHEAELAIVIGKEGRWVNVEDAKDHIFGYTVANDVTARDLQKRDGQWTRGKGFDTFCPIGPVIETEFDATDAVITCHVNDELKQMGSTRDMVFNISQLIAYVSSIMTLLPSDIILTGTPAGVSTLKHGDKISISIEGLGHLINPVVGQNIS